MTTGDLGLDIVLIIMGTSMTALLIGLINQTANMPLVKPEPCPPHDWVYHGTEEKSHMVCTKCGMKPFTD